MLDYGVHGVEPLLKWPGGKRALLPHLLKLIPSSFNRYIEPFLGGGALFFALRPPLAFLSDANDELINCYVQIRDNPHRLLSRLKVMTNSERYYYKIRSQSPRSKVEKAARLIYLTTLAFNGIYRVNLKGKFNVPYGWKKHIDIYQPDKLAAVRDALAKCDLECLDFQEALERARPHDCVYVDPPYTVAHDQNGFRKYNAKIFSWEDQARLARMVHVLDERGCFLIVSNACHPSIKRLYRRFTQIIIERPSVIAASAKHRRSVKELIITNLS